MNIRPDHRAEPAQITVRQWFRLPKAERDRRVTEFRAAVAGLEIIRDATGGAMVPAESPAGLALDDLAGRVNDLLAGGALVVPAMSIPVLVVLGVFASAFTRLNAVILGRPVTIPLLMLVFAVVLLALAVVLAAIVRLILRDGLRFYPNPAT